jgi:hypothetical protein
MGSTEEGLTPRDAVLLAIDAAGGTVEGRTAIQKIAYFVAVALADDLGHRAHYYGPYSRPVEYALAQTALGEKVTETMERFPSYASGPDIRKYTYALTGDGVSEVAAIRATYGAQADMIKVTVDAIHKAVPDFDQNTLSMAAKIHFIVSQQDQPTKLAEIPALANQLGWRISEEQVARSVELLRGLELLT